MTSARTVRVVASAGSRRAAGRAAVLLASALLPAPVLAQGAGYAAVSVTTAQTYDGNVFAAPTSKQIEGDFVSRLGPLLEAGFDSVPMKVRAEYEVDAERYANHPDLNRDIARQYARLALGYLPTPRIGLNVDGSFVETQTPGEFNLDSQLAVGRARADRFEVNSSASYNWSPVTKATVEYSAAHEALEGGIEGATQTARLGFERRPDPRNTYRVGYGFRSFEFNSGLAEPSHLVSAGWLHTITPLTSIEVAAGPRVTNQTVHPEVSATVKHRVLHGEVSAGYSSTQVMAVGESGSLDMHRLAVTAIYRPQRRVALTVAPAASRIERDASRVVLYTVDAEAKLHVNRLVECVASGRVGQQNGAVSGPPAAIPYRIFSVQLTVSSPHRAPANWGPR